jgi:threonine synthase
LVEPASASSVAGVRKLIEVGLVGADETVACVVRGHGLKDPEIACQIFQKPTTAKATQLEHLLN